MAPGAGGRGRHSARAALTVDAEAAGSAPGHAGRPASVGRRTRGKRGLIETARITDYVATDADGRSQVKDTQALFQWAVLAGKLSRN